VSNGVEKMDGNILNVMEWGVHVRTGLVYGVALAAVILYVAWKLIVAGAPIAVVASQLPNNIVDFPIHEIPKRGRDIAAAMLMVLGIEGLLEMSDSCGEQ